MERLWEIDFLRGLSIILMVIFNWSYVLKFLDIYILTRSSLYWNLFPKAIASSFILIAGVSLTLRHEALLERNLSLRKIYRSYIKRSAFIFGLGLGITAVTYISYPEYFIFFGILHLIGFSTLIAIPMIKRPYLGLITGSAILAVSSTLSYSSESLLLASLGLSPVNIQTFDYFPVFPWAGLIFLGIFLGNILYPEGERKIDFVEQLDFKLFRSIGKYLGQNSLLIYLIHQPLIIVLLLILGFNFI